MSASGARCETRPIDKTSPAFVLALVFAAGVGGTAELQTIAVLRERLRAQLLFIRRTSCQAVAAGRSKLAPGLQPRCCGDRRC